MAKKSQTYLFCFDDHRSFSEDVKKRFTDTSRYTVITLHNREDFLNRLVEEKEHNFCKVAILGMHDTKENFEIIDHMTLEIKNIDSRTGIILLAPADKIDGVKKTVRLNIDSYIPRNANSILRIHNTVKKLQSEHSLLIFRKKRNFSFYVFLFFLFISILIAVVAYFRLPMFF
jgi:DNA-binding NarL/FixJ family response regulator